MKIKILYIAVMDMMCKLCGMCLRNHSVCSSCGKISPYYS